MKRVALIMRRSLITVLASLIDNPECEAQGVRGHPLTRYLLDFLPALKPKGCVKFLGVWTSAFLLCGGAGFWFFLENTRGRLAGSTLVFRCNEERQALAPS
jgi:hypothetical protein